MKSYLPIQFENGVLKLLDQRLLPQEEVFVNNSSLEDGFTSIKDMVVRGAPCIGFTAIYTMALWVKDNPDNTFAQFSKACNYLNSARPTAVNLKFELENCKEIFKKSNEQGQDPYSALINFGNKQVQSSEANNLKMAKFIKEEVVQKLSSKKKYKVLTHCNTGFLACGSIGTALGVVEHMASENLIDMVWVDETRPYLQGSRLTAYELEKLNIDHQIVVEGCASHLMKKKLIDFVVVGADRIVANGDTANKIGTSNLSVLANYYNIPFFVVAPTSSFDVTMDSGDEIEIELRPEEEITLYKNHKISPLKSKAFNPSFDVTDGKLISAISCEKGLIKPPFIENLPRIVES